MACRRIRVTKTRVNEIKKKILNRQLLAEARDSIAFTPEPRHLAAFRLLVHAEIEDYLESKAKDGVDRLEAAFLAGKDSVRDNFQIFLVAHAVGVDLRYDARWVENVKAVIKAARKWVDDNNGIKERSFITLSILSGKMPDEIDAPLSASLSSYGTGRGDVAHRSTTRVTTLQTPSLELSTAQQLVEDLRIFFA